MVWSKGWVLVSGIVAALALALVLVVPRFLQREIDTQVEARLAAADGAAGNLLRVYARKWIDAVAQVSSDADLYEALYQASRGGGNLELLHQSAQERLRYFNRDWKASFLVALDVHGRAIARAGLDEETWRDDLGAFPVVGEALQGYRLDDSWDLDGKLYRVCATPVIAYRQYVGALLVGHELGTELAMRMRDTLGVDVAFLIHGKVAGQSSSLPVLDRLPALARAHASEIGPDRHSAVLPATVGEASYGLILAPVDGEAAESDGMYVLMTERRLVGSPVAALRGLAPRDLRWTDLVALLFGVVLVGVGLLALWWEHDRPVETFHRDLQDVGRGEMGRIEEQGYPPVFRALVRAANHAVNRASRSASGRPKSLVVTSGGGIDPSTGLEVADSGRPLPLEPAGSSRTQSDQPVNVSVNVNLSLPEGSIPIASATTGDNGTSVAAGFGLSRSGAGSGAVGAPSNSGSLLGSSSGFASSYGAASLGETPVLASLDEIGATRAASGGSPMGLSLSSHGGPSAAERGSIPSPIAPSGPALVPPPSSSVPLALASSPSTPIHLMQTTPPTGTPAPGSAPIHVDSARPPRHAESDNSGLFFAAATGDPPAATPPPPDEATMSEELAVYREFLATKRSCGESTENVTFERFVDKLRKNRDQLISRFACKSVKFQVYVKDGKAAVKATPIHN